MDEQSSMYELEFPAPQLSAADGAGPVLVHGLEGFTDAGHAVRLATAHLRSSLETELVASFDVDELIDLLVVATDVYTWKLLRRDRELSRADAERRVLRLINAILEAP